MYIVKTHFEHPIEIRNVAVRNLNKIENSKDSVKVLSQACQAWANLSTPLYSPVHLEPEKNTFTIVNVSPPLCRLVPVRNIYQDLSLVKLQFVGNVTKTSLQILTLSNATCTTSVSDILLCKIGPNGVVQFQFDPTLMGSTFCFTQYLQGPFLIVGPLSSIGNC